jgi:hypothetical protein
MKLFIQIFVSNSLQNSLKELHEHNNVLGNTFTVAQNVYCEIGHSGNRGSITGRGKK